MTVKLHSSWLNHLAEEFDKEYMQKLKKFLEKEKASRKIIYPKGALIFNALNTTPLNKVNIVILGQDPYHGPGQAHGLCFSVPEGVKIPPSLVNIFKEQYQDLGITNNTGNLTPWAQQGVLLLNSVLTVEHARAASHQNQGWEQFTDQVISVISSQTEHVVFMLWGSYALRKGAHIDETKHLILKAPHPSPLSAQRGFFGCQHFSKANQYLSKHQKVPINWQL